MTEVHPEREAIAKKVNWGDGRERTVTDVCYKIGVNAEDKSARAGVKNHLRWMQHKGLLISARVPGHSNVAWRMAA